ncbi:uncharacterized protein [Nicotiana sylvestris]|uniref:uncharacterized protein n=1 Tax=Nicotiana sylvestris TaxID=4096 RepID=UPI00388CB643
MEESDAAQGMTRTGRIYTYEHLGGSSKQAATKQPIIKNGLDDLWRKVLNEAYLPNNIICREMTNMVGKVLESHKITYHEDELLPEGLSHNRALHITMQFEDKFVARVLIDGGSNLNICPLSTLKRLGKDFHEIRARSMNVKAFDRSQRATIGEINLCMQMGPTLFDVEFQMLDISATYNLLVIITFPDEPMAVTNNETTQHKDSNSEKEDEIPEEIVREVENFENKPKFNLDETEAVNLGDAETIKETHNIFAWSYDDMTGLSLSIVAYKLPTNPMCPPVKQKLRKFKPDMSVKIKEKVTKRIKAKLLRVVEYPTWLANIVPVPKKDGKVRIALWVITKSGWMKKTQRK